MRKGHTILSILFILLWGLPIIANIVMQVRITLVKEEMRRELKSNSGILQTVVLHESEVVWMDKHEIWVNNSMFDIHTADLKNGVYTFTGLYDKAETNLVKASKKHAENDKNASKLFVWLLFQFKDCVEEKLSARSLSEAISTVYSAFANQALSPANKVILTPPPRHLITILF